MRPVGLPAVRKRSDLTAAKRRYVGRMMEYGCLGTQICFVALTLKLDISAYVSILAHVVDLTRTKYSLTRECSIMQSTKAGGFNDLQLIQGLTLCKRLRYLVFARGNPPMSASHPDSRHAVAPCGGIYGLLCRSWGLWRRRYGTCQRCRLASCGIMSV